MEVERQVQAPPLDAVVGHQSLDRQIQLTDHQPVAIAVRKIAKLVHDIHQLQPVGRVQMHAGPVRVLSRAPRGLQRVVAKLIVFDDLTQGVDPKAVDAAIEPETQDIQHRRTGARVAPVQVGLFPEVGVVVALAGGVVQFPRAPAENA